MKDILILDLRSCFLFLKNICLIKQKKCTQILKSDIHDNKILIVQARFQEKYENTFTYNAGFACKIFKGSIDEIIIFCSF